MRLKRFIVILFTLVLLVIYRLGVHVSVPGVNAEAPAVPSP